LPRGFPPFGQQARPSFILVVVLLLSRASVSLSSHQRQPAAIFSSLFSSTSVTTTACRASVAARS